MKRGRKSKRQERLKKAIQRPMKRKRDNKEKEKRETFKEARTKLQARGDRNARIENMEYHKKVRQDRKHDS